MPAHRSPFLSSLAQWARWTPVPLLLGFAVAAGPFQFEHHFIDPDAPAFENKVGYGETALADLDRDGEAKAEGLAWAAGRIFE